MVAKTDWKEMTEAKPEDWLHIGESLMAHASHTVPRLAAHLELLRGDYGGFPVDRLEHCLQTATRAHRDGRDSEYTVCALLHDIGDTLSPLNHADIAAAIVKPYVSEENHWIMQHHAIFQGHYYHHHLGGDNNARDAFIDSPYYQACVDFCHLYDQNSFDRDYKSEPLEFFLPMLEEVFAAPKNDILKKAS